MRKAWQATACSFGGEVVFTADGAAAGRVTHVVLKQEGREYDWRKVPQALRPGSGAAAAPLHVTGQWLADSVRCRQWLPAAEYAVQPPPPQVRTPQVQPAPRSQPALALSPPPQQQQEQRQQAPLQGQQSHMQQQEAPSSGAEQLHAFSLINYNLWCAYGRGWACETQDTTAATTPHE